MALRLRCTKMVTFPEPHAAPLAPLRQPWRRLITVGRARDLTRHDLQAHLAWLQREVGYDACRFHAVFHDDMRVVSRAADGTLRFNWREIDLIYDTLLSLGLRPFVELNPMPAALASGAQTMFHYAMNVTPPRRWEEWHHLVHSFARHLVERYGLAEVRRWHFEVWNEPNLPGFWSGTKEDYFRLYAEAARALKNVDPQLRVGGPATSKASWIGEFIATCQKENWPLDFVSTHLYPQDEQIEFPDRIGSPHPVGGYFAATVQTVKEVVARSACPELPIHWTEWNTQAAASASAVTWLKNPHVDDTFAATFIAKNCVALDDACDSFGYWVASDVFEENGLPTAPLSCSYGLLTVHGLPKASANAFRLLRRLTGERVPLALSVPHDGCGAVATRDGASVRLLFWNHTHVELSAAPPQWTDEIRVPWTGEARVITARVGPRWGSVRDAWRSLGEPASLDPTQEEYLRQRSEPWWDFVHASTKEGELTLPVALAPGELLFVEIRAEAAVAADGELSSASHEWEQKMGDLSR